MSRLHRIKQCDADCKLSTKKIYHNFNIKMAAVISFPCYVRPFNSRGDSKKRVKQESPLIINIGIIIIKQRFNDHNQAQLWFYHSRVSGDRLMCVLSRRCRYWRCQNEELVPTSWVPPGPEKGHWSAKRDKPLSVWIPRFCVKCTAQTFIACDVSTIIDS